MAATVVIRETNGAAPGTPSDDIANSNYGSTDAVELNAVNNAITPGQNSYEKWQQWNVTDIDTSASIRELKFFSTAPSANTSHHFNGHETQGTYVGANHVQTAYDDPVATDTRTPEAVPTTAPTGPNIGIGGDVAGELTANGLSDFVLSQIRTTGSAIAGATLTNTYRYTEIAIIVITALFATSGFITIA